MYVRSSAYIERKRMDCEVSAIFCNVRDTDSVQNLFVNQNTYLRLCSLSI